MRVLFLCTGNSCRSQMAEGWARHLHGDRVEPCSAGTHPHEVDPRAVRAMAEAGIDIAAQSSKGLDAIDLEAVDMVITVCDDARGNCPVVAGPTRVLHVGFEDPPRLAREAESEEDAMKHYRRVRDQIRDFLEADPTTWTEES